LLGDCKIYLIHLDSSWKWDREISWSRENYSNEKRCF